LSEAKAKKILDKVKKILDIMPDDYTGKLSFEFDLLTGGIVRPTNVHMNETGFASVNMK